ncbi:MAG: cytochrome c [Sterolibacteriaceae bacterium]|nr:cytochrome c [Sterolibacteriaceae bacterium]MBK9084843.1 cytochrome c [Sterolibacteriaceae bacterium]
MHLLCLLGLVLSGAVLADDQRQLVTLPAPAQEALRLEMLDNLVAINEILGLVAADKLKEAGEIAEQKLGLSAQGKHRDKPFEARPGPHMPPAMHSLGMDGHRAASEFAKAAQTGDRNQTLALLPGLTNACVTCHFSYRTR